MYQQVVNSHPQLMKVILPSKSFEYTRKLYSRSSRLDFPAIVDISLLSRYTQRNFSVSSNKHSHQRYNPKQHILLHSASASFPFQYLHPHILWIPTLYSLHELHNHAPFTPQRNSHNLPSLFTTNQALPIDNQISSHNTAKNPFIHTTIFISAQLSTPQNQHLPSPSSLVFHAPNSTHKGNTTHQTSRKNHF